MPTKGSLLLIVIFYGWVATWAVVQVLLPNQIGILCVVSIALGMAPTLWFLRDTKRMNYVIPHVIQPLVVWNWWIIIPIYVVATCKSRGLVIVLAHGILATILTAVLSFLTLFFYWNPF